MPQVIKTAETKIVTKNGECQLSINVEPIVIELTVNVNHEGQIVAQGAVAKPKETEEAKVMVAPDFGGNMFDTKKIQFGKGN